MVITCAAILPLLLHELPKVGPQRGIPTDETLRRWDKASLRLLRLSGNDVQERHKGIHHPLATPLLGVPILDQVVELPVSVHSGRYSMPVKLF
jgi:hypothetical protein